MTMDDLRERWRRSWARQGAGQPHALCVRVETKTKTEGEAPVARKPPPSRRTRHGPLDAGRRAAEPAVRASTAPHWV
jgi:hypothetical protein